MKKTIETNRLILRPFTLEDKESMYNNWASDIEVTKYLTWDAHKNKDETYNILKIWVNQYDKEERINFAIVLKDTNELIGGIDVVGYLEGIPVIGYVLSRKYWSKGIVSEAFKEVIKFLFTLNHKKIIVDAMVENIASNRVIEKCGGVYQSTYDDICKGKNVKINRYIIFNVK